MTTKKMTMAAMFIAVGVLSAHLIYIPVGFAKCFPIQHAINVMLAVLIGTRYAVGSAFCISTLRILLGTGSVLAYPGSMIGAFLSGWLYKKTGSLYGAVIGEIIGTGILGGLLSYPIAAYLLNSNAGAFFFVLPFLVSTTGGSLIAYAICRTPIKNVFKEFIR
jgi:energy coupling factor transporter S component ThiW